MMSNNVFAYIKNYKWRSVFFDYFKIIAIAIVLLFIPYNMLVYTYYNYTMNKEMETYSTQTLLKTSYIIDLIINESEKYYSNVINNSYVQNFLTKKGSMNEGIENAVLKKNIMDSVFSNLIITNEYIESIYICGINNNSIISTKSGGSIDDVKNKPWYQYYDKTKNGTFYLSHTVNGIPILTISKEICLHIGNVEGLFVVNIDLDKLRNIIYNGNYGSVNDFYITDYQGNILFCNDISRLSENFNDNNNLKIDFSSAKKGETVTYKIKNEMTAVLVSPNSNFTYIAEIYNSPVTEKLKIIRLIVAGGGVLSLVLALILAVYISLKMYKSIVELISVLQNPNYGHVNIKDDTQFNETLFISRNIVNIIDSNKKIEEELSFRLQMLKKAQSIALQTQINPHFLFNTLQLVNLIVLKIVKRENDASKIVTLLSDLLRIALDTKENIVPMNLEIEYAQKYIEIQNIKYKGRFNVIWDIEDEVLLCNTVKLVIQPILENSISHGLLKVKYDAEIRIEIKISDDDLYITILDNGVGIEKDKLTEITEKLNSDSITENIHIGLNNVHQRIRLIFGEKYGLSIESEKDKGTTVTIKMPVIKS